MNSKQQLDLMLVDSDGLARARLAAALERALGARISQHDGARTAIATFMRARFDAVVVGAALEDIDPWRFLRMVRSGKFGYAAVPAFLLCGDGERESLLPMLDPLTQLLDRENPQAIALDIDRQLRGAMRDRVLIVEDEPRAAEAAQRALSKYFGTDLAPDGETALALWRRHRHDLVLLDLMLPGMTGRAVLTAMVNELPAQPVIVLTAHDDPDRHQQLILSGAAEFLTKPIDVHFLAETCARVLRESRHMTSLARRAHQERQLHELAARVHAADYSLKRGQTLMATRHLQHAVNACRFNSPSDDQWTSLLTDFS